MSETASHYECGMHTTVDIDLKLDHDGYFWTLENPTWNVMVYGMFGWWQRESHNLHEATQLVSKLIADETYLSSPGTLGYEWARLCQSGLNVAEAEALAYWDDRIANWVYPPRICFALCQEDQP